MFKLTKKSEKTGECNSMTIDCLYAVYVVWEISDLLIRKRIEQDFIFPEEVQRNFIITGDIPDGWEDPIDFNILPRASMYDIIYLLDKMNMFDFENFDVLRRRYRIYNGTHNKYIEELNDHAFKWMKFQYQNIQNGDSPEVFQHLEVREPWDKCGDYEKYDREPH